MKIKITFFASVLLFVFCLCLSTLYAKPANDTSPIEEEVIYGSVQQEGQYPFMVKGLRNLVLLENAKITQFKKYITENKKFSIITATTFFLMVFFAGLIYSFIPGSGKVYAVSYFLSRDLTIGKILDYSYKTAFIHTGITFVMYDILAKKIEKYSLSYFDVYGKYLLIFSSVLIFIMAIFLFFRRVGYATDKTAPPIETQTPPSLYWLVLFVAFSPCIASTQLVIISREISLFYTLVMLAGFILGMTVGLWLFVTVFVIVKRALVTALSGNYTIPSPFKTTLEISALLFMVLVALFFTLFNIFRTF